MVESAPRGVNNEVYSTLGERWYEADDDPIALLRAQARLHVPWIDRLLRQAFERPTRRVLDLGCGGGLVANALARLGHDVVGVDLAEECLAVARLHDSTGRVHYAAADARDLPFAGESFDAVCAMDFLEHVEDPEAVVAESARVLVPGGRFFFHTFNRNPVSWLVVLKGVEWFVRNVPRDLHVFRLFIKPSELEAMCARRQLEVVELFGCVPVLSPALLRMIATGVVPHDLTFRFTRSPTTGYTGMAAKRAR
jgi:2-polyprenyl-6-hydroxyphenyl methylase/3-demethylubiquinone-9 3-methyltransferase